MCLAIPARVTRVEESGAGTVDYIGSEVRTNFALLPDVKVGDWVIIHAGFAISKLSPKEARETLKLFKEMERYENGT
ncbi:HypC/HybG/HupF family hydrogenase formation chaperone [bacterium]|nr:MAG: HypC/HybG/HupF family hydrogenase formation chaperone [bacterium]